MDVSVYLALLCAICHPFVRCQQPLLNEPAIDVHVGSLNNVRDQSAVDPPDSGISFEPHLNESQGQQKQMEYVSDSIAGQPGLQQRTEEWMHSSVPVVEKDILSHRAPMGARERKLQTGGTGMKQDFSASDVPRSVPQNTFVQHPQFGGQVPQDSLHLHGIQDRRDMSASSERSMRGNLDAFNQPPIHHQPDSNIFNFDPRIDPSTFHGDQFRGHPNMFQAHQFAREAFPPTQDSLREDDFVSMTIIVHPALKQCVYYSPNSDFLIDYQVIRGGNLDIGLYVRSPDEEAVAMKRPSPDGSIPINVPPYFVSRPYAICLDNRKASYAEKHVVLSIDLDINWDNPSAHELAAIENLRRRSVTNAQLEIEDHEYTEAWKSIITQLEALFGRMRRIMHLQQKSDNFASIDQSLMEANLSRVTNGSIIQILTMLAVASVQILLIRALFDPKSRFYRIWFGKPSPVSARC